MGVIEAVGRAAVDLQSAGFYGLVLLSDTFNSDVVRRPSFRQQSRIAVRNHLVLPVNVECGRITENIGSDVVNSNSP